MFDLPGIFVFYGDHPVVALDGLTGNHEFEQSLAEGGITALLESLAVRCMVGPHFAFEKGWMKTRPILEGFEVTALRKDVPVGTMRLLASDLVLTDPELAPLVGQPWIGAWSVGPKGCQLR